MRTFVSALGFGKAPCRLEVEFDSAAPSGRDRGSVTVPVFTGKDAIKGRVHAIPLSLKKVEHLGIRVQLVGEIVLKSDKRHPHVFLSLVQDVAPPGEFSAIETMQFAFEDVEMPYESYSGGQVSVRYSVRLFMARSMGQTIIRDHFFDVRIPTSGVLALDGTMANDKIERVDDIIEEQGAVRGHAGREGPGGEDAALETCRNGNGGVSTSSNNVHKIKMEVGIEDCLHIEFEYGKNAYHLNDAVIGRINFMLVRIKLKHMELEIKRRETVGSGIDARLESTTVAKYEIMDGAPTKGEWVPIRMYLSPYPLTPSYENVEGKFSVKYGLNLVLVDEEDRRYFKQHEIRLYRLSDNASETAPVWNLIVGADPFKVEGGAEGNVVTAAGVSETEGTGDESADGFDRVPL